MISMLSRDARSLSLSAQQAIREQAIRSREQSKSYAEIEAIVGVHSTTVCQWYKRYERDGEAGPRARPRGRQQGNGLRLTPAQAQRIQRLITDKLPEQFKLRFALWTRQAVARLIAEEYGAVLAIRTVGDYLKCWGITLQKPAKRAYEQCPKAVQQRLDTVYQDIAARAHTEGAEIHWGDESGVRSDARQGRSYAPRDRTPVAEIPARRGRAQMISTVTNGDGQMRFMLFTKPMHAQLLIRFLQRLIKASERKVFLILDNLRVHHSHRVRDWVRVHSDDMELFYLPSCSPHLNPDEYLNNDLKARLHSNPPAQSAQALRGQILSALRRIQRRAGHLQRYLEHPKVQCAA